MVHYVANTFFELELEGLLGNDLKAALEKNSIFKQLQYIPLIYLSLEDILLVTEFPPQDYLEGLEFPLPKLALLENTFTGECLRTWGASDLIARWSKNRLDMPSLACARKINSKMWHFPHTTPLPGARIVTSAKEIEDAIRGTTSEWVLKTDQGFAGRGHFLFTAHSIDKALEKIKPEGMLLEPWVKRLCDFSSQWYLSKEGEIHLLGLTRCFNGPYGGYLGTETGDDVEVFGEFLPHVLEHVDYCKTYLQRVVKEGFFGHLGVDAMIYEEHLLHPILEVNARMTMSSAILLYHQKHGKDKVTRIYYSYDNSNKKSLLPESYHRKLMIR